MQIRTKYVPALSTLAQGVEARGRIKHGPLVKSLALVTPLAKVRVMANFALIGVTLIGVLTSFGVGSAAPDLDMCFAT
jgi:hypothetical protein